VLCERLCCRLTRSQLFRLNWWQRLSASVPAKLRPYTLDVHDIFEMPPVDMLHMYQVIVCNCGTAGALKTLPSPMLFDVVIVDEASQAMEAEVHITVASS
jgi:superfamily I DNA and/or RNA helicase